MRQNNGALTWRAGRKLMGLFVLLGAVATLAGCPKKHPKTVYIPPGDFQTEDVVPNKKPIPSEKLQGVQQTFRSGRMDLEQCFNELTSRKQSSNLKGKLIIGVTVGLSETASKVWIYKSTPGLKDRKFEACVLKTVKNWSFPTWGSSYDLTSPKYEFWAD